MSAVYIQKILKKIMKKIGLEFGYVWNAIQNGWIISNTFECFKYSTAWIAIIYCAAAIKRTYIYDFSEVERKCQRYTCGKLLCM